MASKDGYKRRQTNNDKSGTAKKVAAAAAASSAKKAVEQAAAKGKAKAKAKTKAKTSSGRTTAEKQRASSVAENTAAAKIQQNRNDRKAERDKRRKERALEQQRALEQAKKTPVSTAAKGKRSAGGDRGRTDAERDRKKSNEQLAAYRAEKERNARSHAEKEKPQGQGRLSGSLAGITEADKRSLTSASRKPRQAELPEGEVAETPFGRLMQKTFYSGLTTGLDSSVRGNLASGVNRLLGASDPITNTVLKYSPAGIGLNLAKDKVIEPALKKLGEDTGVGDAAKKITDWRDKTQAKVTESLLNDKWTRQRDDFNQKLDEAVQKDGAGWRTAGSVGEAAGFLAPSIAAMMLTRNPAAAATRLEKFGKIGQALSKTFGHGSSAGTVAFGLQAKGSYMSQEYEMQKQKVFEGRIKAYETAVAQYNDEIQKINNRGSMTATEEAALSAREKELNKMYEELLTSERDGIDLTCAEILNAAKKADVTSDILALAEVGTEYLFGGIAGLGVGVLDKPVNYVMGRIGRQMLSESTQKGLEQFAKSTAGKMLYNVKNYLGEAGEEAIMQVVQPYIERGVGDLDTANATMKEVAEAGGVGALLSMVLGVPGMAYHVGSRGVQKAREIGITGLRPKAELYNEEKLSDASRNVISSFAASEEGSVLRESAKNNERMTKDEVRDIFDDYLADQGLNEKEEEAIREEIEASGGLSVALAVNMGIEPSRLGVSVKSHLKDLLSGKGDLAHRRDASEVMTNEQRIYTNAQEAVNDLVAQSKKAESGTDLVAYIADEHGNRSISLKAGESNVPIFRTATIDAKTKARMDRMRNAKTETERTGLMYGVKDSVITFAEEVGEGSGRKIIFDAGVGGGQLSQDQIANASYENGEIHINPNSKNPVAQILAHELTHSIEGTAYYEQMKKLVFKYYRSSLTEAQANVKWTYEGQVKSIDDINSEVMAEFFEKKGITDMETLRSIVKENRSFAEKFVDWLNRIIQRITGTKEQRFLLKVRNQWKKALREAKEGIKNTPAEAGVESLYSISRPLKDTDLADYLQAGKRRNKGKQEALERGEKIILTSDEEIRDYILSAIRGNVDMPTVAYAKVSKELSDAVKEANKAFDIEDSYLELVASDLRHAYLSHHKAKEPGDIDLADSDFLNIPNYLENFDRIEEAKRFKNGKQEIMLSAKNENGKLLIVEIVSGSRDSLMFKTMWGLSEEKYEKRKGAADSRGNQKDSTALRSADASSKNSILDSVNSVKGKRLYLSDKRIEDIIERFGASNPHYSQALVTRISPSDFLWITTSSPDIIRSQTADIDMEKLRSNEQTPYIRVDFETGEVIGHEGRHRIAALERAGARSVVITVIPQERGYDRNNAKLIDRMTVTGQFNKVKCTLHKLIPVNESRREDIEKEYGKRNIENRVSGVQYSVSRKADAAYIAAVKRGDMDEAQRMVDEAAKAAGYSNKMYHGSRVGGGFTVFRNWQYFTEEKWYATGYAHREVPDSLYSVYIKIEKPFDTRDEETRELFYNIRYDLGLTELQDDGLPDWTDGYDLVDYIEENNLDYDCILLNEGGEYLKGETLVSRGISYVVRDSAQIKFADPVTYDNNGNVIPLSERFDEKQNDIRYSVVRTTDGRNCVFADSDILYKGRLNGRTEVQAVADAIMSIVGNDYTVLSTGNVTYIGKDLPGEYLYSESAKRLIKAKGNRSKAKKLAAGHLGELIEIAVNPKWQQNHKKKHRTDSQRGWLRYDVHFAVPVLNKKRKMTDAKVYDATLLVRMDADGKDYLYDMIDVKNSTLLVEPSSLRKLIASWNKRQQPIIGAANSSAKQGAINNNSISDSGKDVNEKYSITKKNQQQAASALVAELKESLGQRKTGQKELNALLKAIKDKILDTGAYSYSDVEDVLEQAYSTGGEMEAMADDIAEAKEYLKGQRIYIPKDVRSDVGLNGSLSASNRKMIGNRTSFTTDDSVEGIDVFYREISAEFPSLFPADIYDASEQAKLIYGIATASDRFVSFEQLDNEAEKEGAKPEELIYETMRKDIEDTFKSLARLNAYDEAKPQEKKEASKKNDAEKQRIKDEEGTMRTFDKIRAADRKQRIKEDQEALRLFDKLMREKDRNFEALDHSWKVKTARLVKKHKKELDKELERTTKEVNKARDKREKEVAESYDKIIRDYERGRIKDEERALKLFDKILAEDEALALEFLEIGDFRNVDRVVAFYDRILKSERAKAETKRKAEEALKRREEVMKSRAKDRAAHKERMEKAKEMLRESNKAARANIPKGSRRDMYLKNRSSQKVAKGFVGDILNVLMRIEEGFLTENDISVIKNSKGQEIEVVFDENGQILYERKPGMEHWDISTRVNELTPGLALVYEAEQQGIDGDQFYTIYAALKGQVPDTPIKGLRNVTTKKAKQMRYINSLDLTARQKNFLYLDVCNFYSDGMPLFQDGGTNKAVKGNRRGRLSRMLDEIALDMYAGNTIELKTVNDLVDLALGTERNEQWQKFHRFVMDEIVEASELMLKTKIITEMPVNSKKVKNKGGLKDEFRTLYSRFVAEGEGIETMGSHVDDPLLTARYYAAKASRSVSNEMIFGKSQRDLLGKEVGKSLNKIFKPIAGNEEKMDTLTKYCNYRHDIYRLKYDKGYTGLSVEELEEHCRNIEESDPDIVAIADEVVGYARNLLKMCVQANRISQADYEFFVERYPYYVPTFRVTVDEVLRDNKVKFRKIRVIKEAQGGSEELLPLFEQLVRRTHEMIKACKLNMLAQQIAMNARKPESRPFVEQPIPAEDTVKEDVAADIASMGAVEDVGQRTKERGFNNYIPWWSNGKQYNIPVTDEHVLYAWDRINYKIDENLVHKVLRNVNNVRRGVLTQYSPTFPITNGIRDYFDMFIYNKHAHRLPKFHALALKGIFTRSGKEGEMFHEYMSYGASNASIFEYANTNAGKKPRYTKARAVFEKIDAINFMIEQSPRFAVYLETVDRLEKQRKKGKNKYTDEEIKTIASYNAADATLNFGRSGTYIKAANTYGITFINAGFQGADRLRKMFAQTAEGTLKEQILSVIGLAIKAGLLGMAPNAIITVIWNSGIMRAIVGDDDYDRVKREYDEMSDFTKINYLVFWINGTWVKIPTGRVLSWLWSHIYLAEEVYDGDMDPLDAIVAQMQNFAENILPANPVTNGILGPLVEVALNKNWMGYAIVDDWYKREDGFRYLEYDEDTTEAAKAIAAFGHYITGTIWGREDSRVLDLSPMKLDYLMQQYFGSYSGIVMPFLSGSQVSVSEKGYEALMSMAQKFYTDPVYSNRLANDYYTAKNYVDAVSEVYDKDTPYAVASDYFKEHGEKLKEVRDEIDAVNRNTNLSRKERKEKARELRERLNDLYREGLNGWEDILGYAMQNYDGKDRNKSTYNDAVGSVKGVEYSISTLSDTAQEQYKACSADGVSAEDFYDAYKFSQEVKSTRDASGKEVEGESKQDKVTAYLESRDASAAEKKSMWKNLFGYKSDPPAFSDGGSVSYNPGTAGSPILDSSARISSGYGPRNAPTAGASSYHRAIDIAAPGGTAVAAAMNGTVTRVSRSGGYGISVEVTTKGDDGNSYVTKYSHLLNTGVEVGQNVQKGVKIAEVDSTGTSTGNHLDFKLAINGDWVDPTQYLTAIGNGSLTDSGYSTKGGSGGSSTVRGGGGGGKRRSGGGSRRSGGGSRKSGGSLGTFAVAGRENKATVKDVSDSDGGYTFSRQGSGTSGSSAVASSKPVSNHAGTSTKNEKYASHGAYLPKASDSPYLPRYSDIASNNTRTKKTTRSNGRSMWDESVLG